MNVLVVTFLSLVDFCTISMPMVSATASYYTLMSFELVQPMKNKSFLFNILAVKRFHHDWTMIFQVSEFVPYIHFPKKNQKTATGGTKSDLNIGCPGFGFHGIPRRLYPHMWLPWNKCYVNGPGRLLSPAFTPIRWHGRKDGEWFFVDWNWSMIE